MMLGSEILDVLFQPREWMPVLQRRARGMRFRRGRIHRWETKAETHQFEVVVRGALLGKSRSQKYRDCISPLAAVLVTWHQGRASHRDATAEARQHLDSVDSSVVSWQDLVELSRQLMRVGLFEASLLSMEKSWKFLEDEWARGARDAFTAVSWARALIYAGDAQGANDVVDSLMKKRVPKYARHAVEEIAGFTNVARDSGAESSSPLPPRQQSDWTNFVRGKTVLIYGPAEVVELPEVPGSCLVARIIGPGVYQWDSDDDLLSNQTDVVYSIRNNIEKGLSEVGGVFRQRLLGYRFVCIKRGGTFGLPNGRSVPGFGGLFMSGHPQMVPLCALDIVRSSALPVVIGADFFSSEVAYRESDRRLVGWGQPSQRSRQQSVSGSDGGAFDRCSLMASHNIFENWALVKFLFDAGKIRGDSRFAQSMNYSIHELALRYDEVIGSKRQ